MLEAVRPRRSDGPLGGTPLIGFAGAPFTLASYLIEGGPSRDHARTKALMYSDPGLWNDLADRLARIAGAFLRMQVLAGASAVQLFDSWAGALPAADYEALVLPHVRTALSAVEDLSVAHGVPRILFGVGTGELLATMSQAGSEVMGVDFRVPLDQAATRVRPGAALQGNLDPAVVQASPAAVDQRVDAVLAAARRSGRGHIFNLGHGVLPGHRSRGPDPDRRARARRRPGARGRTRTSGSGRPPEGGGWHSGPVTAKRTTRRTGASAGSPTPSPEPAPRRHVVVVGGGISGLAAAWYLVRTHSDIEVTLLEAAPHVGGKLSVSDVAGIAVDEGAESFVASRPEALRLAREVGLETDLVTPAVFQASVFSRGRIRAMPRGQFMGIPTDLRSLAASEVLSPAGLLRVPLDRVIAPTPHGPGRLGGRVHLRDGWVARSSTGWSSRCSAGSTPGAPMPCRCRPRCPRCSASCDMTGRCSARPGVSPAAAWRPPEPGAGCRSGASSAASDASRARWPRPSWAAACRSAPARRSAA